MKSIREHEEGVEEGICTVVCKIVRVYIVDKKNNNNANELLFVCTKERKKEAGSLVLKPERPVDVDEEHFAI